MVTLPSTFLPCQIHHLTDLGDVPQLPRSELGSLEEVCRTFPFQANEYYLGLIDWDDPDDPIRRLVIPDPSELDELEGPGNPADFDPCDEAAHTVVRGLQHKYPDTVLILATGACSAYCRFCFRKRLFVLDSPETVTDLEPALAYVRHHREITDVLLTGGDPLVLPTETLAGMVERFAAMENVNTIRIGSKTPAYNPFRILNDDGLQKLISRVVAGGTAVYIMTHFDHPRELTGLATQALLLLRDSGALLANQCPLLRGVNDDPAVLRELFQAMTRVGAPQYYLFQNRPTAGNRPYARSLTDGWRIFSKARYGCSGLSRRARFCMSHALGKIEVVGLDGRHIYCRFHRACDPELENRILVCQRNDQACWFDELEVDLPELELAGRG
jgi:lysine 2,3-aminomutase